MDEAEKELGEAVKVAEGGMHFERLRIQNAQNQLAKATKPEERQAAQNEISAAQKAGQIASKKYFRGKGLLNNVRVKMGKSRPSLSAQNLPAVLRCDPATRRYRDCLVNRA